MRELRSLVRNLVVKSPIPIFDEFEVEKQLSELSGYVSEKNAPAPQSPQAEVSEWPKNFPVEWNKGFDEIIESLEKFLLQESLKRMKPQDIRDKLKLARSRYYEKMRQHGLHRT